MARATKPPGTATRKPRAPAAPLRPKGRTLAEFLPLRRCEQRLLEACRKGEVAVFNGGKRPKEKPADEQDRPRPGFVRFLCLGGDEQAPVHERGVQIEGGWIEGDLDLQACILPNDVLIRHSVIDGELTLRDASCEGIDLTGSKVKGIDGGGVEASGSIGLNLGFHAAGEVNLVGAQIGGDLACVGGSFENSRGNALACDRAKIGGSAFLRNGFYAVGEVRMLNAQIFGDLDCSNGRFENEKGRALNCDSARVQGRFFFRNLTGFVGSVSLGSAQIGTLLDDNASWALAKAHILDGFRYSSIGGSKAGHGPSDAESRIVWLDNQLEDHCKENFKPQPWQQLVRTLRRMGHGAEADEVAMAFQERRRKAGKVSGLAAMFHALFGVIAGYGYRPLRLLGLMVAVWLGCGILYQNAAHQGWIAPTQPHLFQHERYQPCRPENGGNWVTCEKKTPPEYTTFNALAYSLDLILPLVELQQDRDWAPIVGKTPGIEQNWTFGGFTRVVMWFEILFGWIASLLLVAVLTGLTNREGKGEA